MAITTLDGLIAAAKIIQPFYKTASITTVAGSFFSNFATAGAPGAGVLAGGETSPPANTSGRVTTDAIPGYPVITFTANRTYINRLDYSNTVVGQFILFDRLWVGGTYAFNANVNVTSGSWASRVSYDGGSANYNGLELWVETVGAATGNQTWNVTYTDQGGASGSTGAVGIGAAPIASRCWQLPLASGDSGLSAITNVTGGTGSAGTANIMVLRPLVRIYVPVASQIISLNFTDLGLPEIFNDSALYALYMSPAGTALGVPWSMLQLANG